MNSIIMPNWQKNQIVPLRMKCGHSHKIIKTLNKFSTTQHFALFKMSVSADLFLKTQ